MEPNVPEQLDQAVQPEPQAQEPQVQETEQASTQDVAPEAQVETPDTSTTSEVVEPVSTDVEPEEEISPAYQAPEFDINQLPRDPENPDYVDPNAFVAALTQQAREQARAEFAEQRREEKLWAQAEEAYPELKQNKELRDLVHNSRMGEIMTGKNPAPKAIADKLFKHIATAKKDGVVQAQNNVTVQEQARLETSSTTSQSNATDRSSLLSQLGSFDSATRESATDALLKDMFDRGDLKMPQ